MFKERYSIPQYGDPYYMTEAAGGLNKCISINNGFVLANCTGYAYGRFMEEANIRSCSLSAGNAQSWYGNTGDGYQRGQTPKLGAVMCWCNKAGEKYGHVAIVEEINTDGSVIASMSNWSENGTLPAFERRRYAPPYLSPTGLPFQGFIYNPYLEQCDIPAGASDIEINGHSYSLYRQKNGERAVVLSAGLNKLAGIRSLDANVYVYAKITGANYFQMKEGQADPYGTTYGDLSSPLNEAFTEVPNQDSTLYMDMESGDYGDCTGVHVNPEHNVFSPALVYPAAGNYQYARMVGKGHVNTVSRYAFTIRLNDGTFILGIANQDLTPAQIATDFRAEVGASLDSISILDGGGSAQMGRYEGKEFKYIRDTGRECPSAVAIVSDHPIADQIHDSDPWPEPITVEPEPDPVEDPEVDPVADLPEIEKPAGDYEVPEIIIDDHEEKPMEDKEITIREQVAKLIDVKSLITFGLIGTLCYLAINGKELDSQFMTIVTAVTTFYFSYQVKKNGDSK